jgi:hypothetical protein
MTYSIYGSKSGNTMGNFVRVPAARPTVGVSGGCAERIRIARLDNFRDWLTSVPYGHGWLASARMNR